LNPAAAVDAGPYDLAPRGEATGDAALCIHGLTGMPYEVRPIAEALADRGLRARGPLLPGHGGEPEVLAKLPYTAWTEAVGRELAALRRDHERVFVCGLSLGGLLTLWLAAREPVAAAAVIGTPLRFPVALRAGIAVARYLRPMWPKTAGPGIAEERARARHPGMAVMPMASVHQLTRLQRVVRASLGSIRAPLFVAHGALDQTANPADLATIAASVSSDRVERLQLERSAHIVPVDFDGPELCEAVADFFAVGADPRRPAGPVFD